MRRIDQHASCIRHLLRSTPSHAVRKPAGQRALVWPGGEPRKHPAERRSCGRHGWVHRVPAIRIGVRTWHGVHKRITEGYAPAKPGRSAKALPRSGSPGRRRRIDRIDGLPRDFREADNKERWPERQPLMHGPHHHCAAGAAGPVGGTFGLPRRKYAWQGRRLGHTNGRLRVYNPPVAVWFGARSCQMSRCRACATFNRCSSRCFAAGARLRRGVRRL